VDDYSRLAKARADHEELKAALRDLEVKQKTGELLPRDAVAKAWSEQIAVAKGRLLALPSRVSAEVLRLKSQREIERVLKSALIVILEELARDGASYGLDQE
jgi:Ribonuclease G/E